MDVEESTQVVVPSGEGRPDEFALEGGTVTRRGVRGGGEETAATSAAKAGNGRVIGEGRVR